MAQKRTDRHSRLLPDANDEELIRNVGDVVVFAHTAVGDDLRGVATRSDDSVSVEYRRDDLSPSGFENRVAGLPPVPTDAAFASFGDDSHTVVWVEWKSGGLAICLEPDVEVSIPQFVEELRTLGLA